MNSGKIKAALGDASHLLKEVEVLSGEDAYKMIQAMLGETDINMMDQSEFGFLSEVKANDSSFSEVTMSSAFREHRDLVQQPSLLSFSGLDVHSHGEGESPTESIPGSPSSPPPSMMNFEVSQLAYIRPEKTEEMLDKYPDDKVFHAALSELLEYTGVTEGRFIVCEQEQRALIDGTRVLALLDKYTKSCEKYRKELLERVTARDSWIVSQTQRVAESFKLERNTWSLVSYLLKQELKDREMGDANQAINLVDVNRNITTVVDDLYKSSKDFRKRLCVLEWLESLALEEVQLDEGANFGSEDEVMWEQSLKNLQRGAVKRGQINSLDPDANIQAAGKDGVAMVGLDDEDEKTEVEVLTGVWTLLRSGQLHEAISFCVRRGHHWRAATLRGAEVFESERNSSLPYLGGGNPRRGMWLENCASYCDSLWRGKEAKHLSRVGELELAIAACLSCNLKVLRESPLCSAWEAQTWAMFKCSHDFMVNKAIFEHQKMQCKASKYYPGMDTVEYNNKYLKRISHMSTENEHTIFSQIKFENPGEPSHIFHGCQAAVIKGLSDAYQYLDEVLHPTLCSPNIQDGGALIHEYSPGLYRFSAHAAIYLWAVWSTLSPDARKGAPDFPSKQAEAIILRYIEHLVDTKQQCLTALYISFFPEKIRNHTFAKILETVTSPKEERKNCLRQAQKHFPGSVEEILRQVVLNVCNSADRNQKEKIDVLHWLCLERGHAHLALKHSLALVRQFLETTQVTDQTEVAIPKLAIPNLEYCLQVFELLQEGPAFPDQTQTDAEQESVPSLLKEYSHWELFFSCHTVYADWSSSLAKKPIQGKFQEPSDWTDDHLEQKLQYTLDVRAESSKLAKHTADIIDKTEAAITAIENLLLCEGGWLRFSDSDKVSLARFDELRRLQSWCLPQALFMLHRVCHSTAEWCLSFQTGEDRNAARFWFQRSMNISNLVANENYKLYQQISSEDLTKFLGLIHQSSMCLLRIC